KVLVPGIEDAREQGIIERTPQVDADDFRAERGGYRTHAEIGLHFFFLLPVPPQPTPSASRTGSGKSRKSFFTARHFTLAELALPLARMISFQSLPHLALSSICLPRSTKVTFHSSGIFRTAGLVG